MQSTTSEGDLPRHPLNRATQKGHLTGVPQHRSLPHTGRMPTGSPPGAEKVPPPRLQGDPVTTDRRISGDAAAASASSEATVVAKRRRRASLTASFADRLVTRVRTRRVGTGRIHVLDLRGKRWTGIRPTVSGYLTLRNPNDPRWPHTGQTTSDRAIAEAWVRTAYVPWLERKAEIVASGPQAGIRVDHASEKYLAVLQTEYGPDHNTVRNRRSACSVHVVPALGSLPLDALTKAQVREFLTELKVVKSAGGETRLEPAKERTKGNVRAALLAVWNHTYPDVAPPFAGIRLREPRPNLKLRAAAELGAIGVQAEQTAYTYEEVLRLLVEAVSFDEEIMGRPNLACQFVPNTAEAIALILGTTARIEESTFLRWHHVRLEEGAIFIPGTKTYNAPRWLPLQLSLKPWLARLMAQQGGTPAPNSFVLRTRWRQPLTRASRKTWGARIARVEVRAGLKLEQKATHILRATHLSWAKDCLSLPDLKAYAGHGGARGGATDSYIDKRPPFMPAEHRAYLNLPSPEEVLKRLRAR